MKQVLIATYNYFPYHWGGSEVYVRGLAGYLGSKGYAVKILAAVPEQALADCELLYSDPYLRVGTYSYENVQVLGCVLNPSTEEIYSRYNPAWKTSWESFFNACWKDTAVEFFHLHAHTPLISAALCEAVQAHFPGVKTLFSYHVADSCPKGSLLYFDKETCKVRPSIHTCAACVIHSKWHVSPTVGKLVQAVWPDAWFPASTPAILRPKYLTRLALESFGRLAKVVDRWHVFSDQIETNLHGLGVDPSCISVIRHGAADHYLTGDSKNREDKPVLFAYAGRFKKLKGLHTLLKAWSKLPVVPDRKLWIIGDGAELEPDLARLIQQAKAREDIEFLGTYPAETLKAKLDQVHCVIIPSEVVETGPLIFHEAIASGANIIASDMGGCASLTAYYGEGCQVFKTGQARDLTDKILSFQYRPIRKKVLGLQEHFDRLLQEYEILLQANLKHATI